MTLRFCTRFFTAPADQQQEEKENAHGYLYIEGCPSCIGTSGGFVRLFYLFDMYRFFTGEPLAEFPQTPPCKNGEDRDRVRNWKQGQGRRDDRILPTLKIAGNALVKDPLLSVAICDPSGPPDLLPLALFPISYSIPVFLAKRRRNESLGKNPSVRHGQPDRRGPTGHKSQPLNLMSVTRALPAILRGGKRLSERRPCLLMGFFPMFSFLLPAFARRGLGKLRSWFPNKTVLQ